MGRFGKYILLIITLIVLDQLTKYIVQHNFFLGESVVVIKGLFSFTYIKNPGVAFGIGANSSDAIRKPLFLFLPTLVCFWLCWLIWSHRQKDLISGLAYSLILAGAIGNLIDRFSKDYVIDFLDFHIGDSHFPAFNIADSAITIAAGLLILDFIIKLKEEKR